MSWDPMAAQSAAMYGQAAVGAGQHDASKTTLWMGDLEPWMDENYIKQLWYSLGENVNVKMIRDKFTGGNAGYCFVDFGNAPAAMKYLSTINGTLIPGTNRVFKLNWASGGGLNDRKEDRGPEFSIFVGDLGPEVNDFMLLSTFQQRYISCKSAKVVTDPMTGMSRGYGFVRFSDEGEQQRAMGEMQGQYCGSRPMRISMATPKNKAGGGSSSAPPAQHGYYSQAPQAYNQFTDPNNTTVFVGGLNSGVHEDELRSYFQPFGEITYVKIPPGKGCGFVQYVHRQSAEMAIQQMNGYSIASLFVIKGGSRVRLSWGRSQTQKDPTPAAYRPPPPTGYPPAPGPGPMAPYGAPAPYAPAVPGPMAAAVPPPMAPVMAPSQQQQPQQPEDPLQPVPVEKMNEQFIAQKEELMERTEIDGWRSAQQVYAQ
ncbi:hypothetical protein HK102_006355 [Quaeritorhiza haematococci]|nr:hypothetical protein HK102_006355 [Quaeritorhiza haematococci]